MTLVNVMKANPNSLGINALDLKSQLAQLTLCN